MAPDGLAIEIRPLDEIGADAVVGLAASYYPAGHDARRREYLDWLYNRNPFGQGRIVAALERGLLIGMMGLIPFRLRCDDGTFIAHMVVNVLTHPRHRTKSLFVKMIRVAKHECDEKGEWLIGHPNDAAYPGWKRNGMVFQPGYDMKWIAPLRPLPLRGFRRRADVAPNELPCLDFGPLLQWQSNVRQPVIAADAAFIEWRFFRHPTRSYRVGSLRQGNLVLGYWVRRAFRPMVDLIVDWQGGDFWKAGPPASLWRPSLIAWPVAGVEANPVPVPRRLWALPRVHKYYRFFATPPAQVDGSPRQWHLLTLAATDFG